MSDWVISISICRFNFFLFILHCIDSLPACEKKNIKKYRQRPKLKVGEICRHSVVASNTRTLHLACSSRDFCSAGGNSAAPWHEPNTGREGFSLKQNTQVVFKCIYCTTLILGKLNPAVSRKDLLALGVGRCTFY